MQKLSGVISLVVGVLVLVWGYEIARAPGNQITQVFTGSVPAQAMYRYIIGAALVLFGLFQIFRK